MHFAGVARALGGETDPFQVGIGDQAVGDQRGGDLVEAEAAGRQWHRGGHRRVGGRAGKVRGALVHPPKSS